MRQTFKCIFLFLSFFIVACENEDIPVTPSKVEQTVLMYLPWANNLLPFFETNISDMESVVARNILQNERIIVFLSTTATKASLFELKYEKGKCVRIPLKEYDNPAFTTVNGIAGILNDAKSFAPARRYAMTIGCHGMGWIPVSSPASRSIGEKEYWEYEGVPLTRYFGGTEKEYQTDISTLAEGIAQADIKMEYILFDDCYMSSIEVAYDLKEVADYLIACPTEIMAYGMPYAEIGPYLFGDVDYENISNAFLHFYKSYSDMPCGTIGITFCPELDNLASVMKKVNDRFALDTHINYQIQRMDGYSPVRFFDFGDYVSKLCKDPELMAEFEAQFERTVPGKYKKHTEYYYSMSMGKVKINTYSGITTSESSVSSSTQSITETSWYKATH